MPLPLSLTGIYPFCVCRLRLLSSLFSIYPLRQCLSEILNIFGSVCAAAAEAAEKIASTLLQKEQRMDNKKSDGKL